MDRPKPMPYRHSLRFSLADSASDSAAAGEEQHDCYSRTGYRWECALGDGDSSCCTFSAFELLAATGDSGNEGAIILSEYRIVGVN